MSDYVTDLSGGNAVFANEARRTAQRLRQKATLRDGIIRWNSNGSVPPADCVRLAAYIGLPVDEAACAAVRGAELAAFLAEYRRTRAAPSAEERAEARAEHGPGVELVAVLSGRRFTT